MLHVANHEAVVPDVAAKAVDAALPDVAQVAGAEGKAGDGEVQGEEMAHGRGIARMGEAHVAVVVAQRHFIVGLSVARREHGAQERQAGLVACGERHLPDAEGIDGHHCRPEVQLGLRLHRVVGVAVVVDGSYTRVDFRPGHETQPVAHGPVVVPTVCIVEFAAHLVGVPGGVGGEAKESVEHALCGDAPVQPVGLAQGFVKDAQVGTRIGEGREISFVQTAASGTEKRGVRRVAVVR